MHFGRLCMPFQRQFKETSSSHIQQSGYVLLKPACKFQLLFSLLDLGIITQFLLDSFFGGSYQVRNIIFSSECSQQKSVSKSAFLQPSVQQCRQAPGSDRKNIHDHILNIDKITAKRSMSMHTTGYCSHAVYYTVVFRHGGIVIQQSSSQRKSQGVLAHSTPLQHTVYQYLLLELVFTD